MQRWKALPAAVLGLSLLVAACSAKGTTNGTSSTSTTTGSTASDAAIHLLAIEPGPASNTYWGTVNAGLQDASKDLGVTTTFMGPSQNETDPNAVRQLILTAIAQHPDGMLINDDLPASETAAIKQAVGAKIPVILTDVGQNQVTGTGALSFVGPSATAGAATAGQLLMADGCKDVLIVNEIKGAAAYSDQRTAGFLTTFKNQVTNASFPNSDFGDASAMEGIVKTLLLKDRSIDCTFSVGGEITPAMVAAVQSLGSRAHKLITAGIDTSTQILDEISAGQLTFAIDDQPFSEGYLAVVAMTSYLRYGQTPSTNISTGLAVVSKANVAEMLKFNKQGVQ